MKNSILLLLFLSASSSCLCQQLIGKKYTIIPDFITVYGLDSQGNIDKSKFFRASSNTKFTITGIDTNNNIKISFWRYRWRSTSKDTSKNERPSFTSAIANSKLADDGKNLRQYPYRGKFTRTNIYEYPDSLYISSWANYRTFIIKPSVLSSSCLPYYAPDWDLTWGVMTLPIKLRFGNGGNRFFDYEEKLNLGFVFGVRKQIKGTKEQAINLLGGFGVSSVRTDSLSLKNPISSASTSSAAFSLNVGGMYQYENFQVGLFLGMDQIAGNLGRDWRYQGIPWVGLAIGVSLYSKNNTQKGEGENKVNNEK